MESRSPGSIVAAQLISMSSLGGILTSLGFMLEFFCANCLKRFASFLEKYFMAAFVSSCKGVSQLKITYLDVFLIWEITLVRGCKPNEVVLHHAVDVCFVLATLNLLCRMIVDNHEHMRSLVQKEITKSLADAAAGSSDNHTLVEEKRWPNFWIIVQRGLSLEVLLLQL